MSYNICRSEPVLCLNGVDINSKNCTNTFIRQIFYQIRSIKPRGKFFWNVCSTDIKWEKAWSLPCRFCISNILWELHLKILHNIYVRNYTLSKCMDIDENCLFCSDQPEKLVHLFYECNYLYKNVLEKTDYSCDLTSKDVLFYFESKSISVNFMLNLMILFSKFHIHKSKINNSKPCLKFFMVDVHLYMDSLQFIDSKKCKDTIVFAKELNLVEK